MPPKKKKISHTYRQGKKLKLEEQPDEIVVRAPLTKVKNLGIDRATEQVSSASVRVKVDPDNLEDALAKARKVATSHRSYRRADTGDEFLITDRVFVTFHEPPSDTALSTFVSDYALIPLERYSDVDFLFQLTDHTGMNPLKLVVKLTEEDGARVKSAENDVNKRASTSQIRLPTDPQYGRQWFLHRNFRHSEFDLRSSARCEEAWQLLDSYGSPDVVVAVSDDGCRLDHPDFDSATKLAGWAYFEGRRLVRSVDIDADPGRMYEPGETHGTSCAGVIAGEVDGLLTVGAAPGVKLLPVKWQLDDDGYLMTADSKMLTLLNYIAERADIFSNSWSSVPDNQWAQPVVNRIRELAESGGRRGSGILILWAAGNENCPLDYDGDIDIPYDSGWEYRDDGQVWVGVSTSRVFTNNLVDIPGVGHIAAVASNARRSHYSNYGDGISLCAPSSNSHAFDRAVVPGLEVTTASSDPPLVAHDFGGTSSATPLVAGIAALVISANPQLSAIEVLSLLKLTASKDLDFTGYRRTRATSYDDGSWDVSPVAPHDKANFVDKGLAEGTWSPWFGHGRVDAREAVVEALRLAGQSTGLNLAPIEGSARPNLRIPDADPVGVSDVIHVVDQGALKWIEVRVNITHKAVGDLLLRLVAPDGTKVILHRRAGGSNDDLRESYNPHTRQALQVFVGKQVRGDWTLEVSDRKARNQGTLKSWSIAIVRDPGSPEAVDATPVAIADGSVGGIVRTLQLPTGPTIRDIDLTVEVTHPWVSDLHFELRPPIGASIPLSLPTGAPNGNLRHVWSSRTDLALAVLRNRNPAGAWRLHVADLVQLDVGTLDRWSINVIS